MKPPICIGTVAFTEAERRDAAAMAAAGLSYATIARRLGGCTAWHIRALLSESLPTHPAARRSHVRAPDEVQEGPRTNAPHTGAQEAAWQA